MPEKHSKSFKQFFNEQFELWSLENNLSLRDLADRCGVTSSYLGQVKNYGRIPGLPVLILLAFNFKLSKPADILKIAEINSTWPYRPNIKLKDSQDETPGFINFKIDMSGFQGAIREIVRDEIRPQSLPELNSKTTLRIGINPLQSGFQNKSKQHIFQELFQLITVSMHANLEFVEVDHRNALEMLKSGRLDIYGPLYITASRIGHYTFSEPLGHSPMSVFWRTAPSKFLEELPIPQNLQEIKKNPYKIAVLAETCSHDFARNILNLNSENLIICENPEEIIERVTLSGLKRSAHFAFCDLLTSSSIQEDFPSSVKLLFKDNPLQPGYDLSIAVREDWPDFLRKLNTTITFLKSHGSLEDLYQRHSIDFLNFQK